ncbi:hypothetical protein ON010_g729 [Phytophthora cinnamomi]|nr:hypothetical protein ON010_g729 [Phytophthora cinnamomi]
MRRTAALEKFSAAAINFWQYLQKYNRMCRLVRLFKFVAMEEQRLTIVEEIDQLFRMLNLATAVTVMTSAADASRNAKMLFETLENMHGDIKLTHEEILKVLFTDKQRSDMKLQRIVLDNDVVDRVGVDRVLVHQVSMLSYNGALETADPLHIVEGSPRAVDGGNTMVKTEWGVRSDEVEEESPVYTNELESITADVVPRTRMPTVQEVLGDIIPAAAHEDKEGEEKEPSIRQLTPAQDVADEPTDENKSSCHEEPAPIQNTVDKAVESKNKEEEREPSSQQCASVPATVDNVIDEEEEKGENEQQSLIRPSVDESIEEQEEQEIEPRDEQLDEMVEGKEHEGNEVSIEQPASMQDSADEVLDENETEENGEASDQHPAEVVEGKDLSGNHSARIQATTDDAIETEENNLSDQQSRVAVDDKDIETVEHEQIEKNGPKSSQPAPTRDTADEMVEDEREKESGPSTEKSDVLVEVAKAEENEPSDDQSAVMQDTTNYEVEEDVQATDDEVVEEEKGEEDESISGQPEPMTGEPIYDQIEEMVENNEGNEANSLRSASFSDTTTDEETDEVYQVRLEPSSVALLIQRLGSDQVPAQQQEDTLLDLLGMCVTHTNRVQIYKTKGIPVLTNLVRNGETFLTQLYALHCLSWFTFSFSKIREDEFEELHSHVREPTHVEMLTLLHELQSCDDGVKERAALQCSCMATRGVADALRQVGVLPLLIDLLKNGTTNQKLWATEALLTLASDNDENCVAITRGGAIPLLVSLLRTGTDMHKQEAAYALGNLAANNEVNRAKIAREGAIPPLVKFVKSVTDAQNQWAVFALGCLSLNNEENRVLIAQEGAIRPLVELLRVGKRGQKQWAAYTLGNLAQNDANLH